MKKSKIRYLPAVICMLAAGICYTSCGRESNQADPERQVLTMDLGVRQTEEGTESQSGLILTGTETDSGLPEGSGTGSSEEPLFRQTESVRFYVHICGEVKDPGVYEMEPGDRVFRAVELAGGFTEEAARDYLNMAQETADGMKITVPSRRAVEAEEKETASWIQMPGTPEERSPGEETTPGKIDLNTASMEELMTLRGIGQAKAEAVIRYREEQGPFRTTEEIMKIPGIKEAAFQKIKDDITVQAP